MRSVLCGAASWSAVARTRAGAGAEAELGLIARGRELDIRARVHDDLRARRVLREAAGADHAVQGQDSLIDGRAGRQHRRGRGAIHERLMVVVAVVFGVVKAVEGRAVVVICVARAWFATDFA